MWEKDTLDLFFDENKQNLSFVSLLYITNRFDVAVFSNIMEDVKMWQEHQ